MRKLFIIILSLVVSSAFAQKNTEVTYNLNEVEIIRGRTHSDSIDFRIKKISTSTDIYFTAQKFGFRDSTTAANSIEEQFVEMKEKYPNQQITFTVDKNRDLIPSDSPFKVKIGKSRDQLKKIAMLEKLLEEKEQRIEELESNIKIEIKN
jgi:hypothetical protein